MLLEPGRIIRIDHYSICAKIENVHFDIGSSDAERTWQSRSDNGKTENMCTKKFDCDKICGILKIRYRMAGDYLVIHPDGRRKSLSDYFTDSKIPRTMRDRIPLVACGSEILWVIGLRTGESCRIDSGTRRILSISADMQRRIE